MTENGEATITIGFSQPMEFTYQASLQSGGDQKELNSPIGLLTVTKGSMKLKLMPPVCGTFDVVVFARPANTTGTFSWVCSFTLECPEPAPVEELPENPFLSWGLQQNAWSLGLKPCPYGSDAMILESGSFELVLRTIRPLMVLCELTHKDLDTALAKQCLMTQIEPNQLTCHVLCPYVGYYRLSVFVRDYDNHGDSFQNAGNFLLRCTGGTINLNELFPANLSPSCGPGVRTLNAGLSKFSHTAAQLVTQQGKCNITFHNSQDLELHAVLSKDRRKRPGHPLTRHVFFTYNGGKVTVSVALPESGIYKLSLYGKNASSANQEFSLLCDFVLRSSSEISWPPFPCSYTAWQKGYVLFEPRTGLLEPESWVRFRVRVPGACRVSVQGEQRTELQLNNSRVWEGEVYTGNSAPLLKLAAMCTAGREVGSNNMEIIMSFDILSRQNEL